MDESASRETTCRDEAGEGDGAMLKSNNKPKLTFDFRHPPLAYFAHTSQSRTLAWRRLADLARTDRIVHNVRPRRRGGRCRTAQSDRLQADSWCVGVWSWSPQQLACNGQWHEHWSVDPRLRAEKLKDEFGCSKEAKEVVVECCVGESALTHLPSCRERSTGEM